MQRILALVLLVIMASCSSYVGPIGGDSPEHLVEMCRQYHENEDIRNMLRLYRTDDVPQASLERLERTLELFFDRDLLDVRHVELPQEARDLFNQAVTTNGQRVAFNLPVLGQIMATYGGNRQEAFLYGLENGRYFFTLQTSTPL